MLLHFSRTTGIAMPSHCRLELADPESAEAGSGIVITGTAILPSETVFEVPDIPEEFTHVPVAIRWVPGKAPENDMVERPESPDDCRGWCDVSFQAFPHRLRDVPAENGRLPQASQYQMIPSW